MAVVSEENGSEREARRGNHSIAGRRAD